MWSKLSIAVLDMVLLDSAAPTLAADRDPAASPEVAAAMQLYVDQYKLAGIVLIIADKNGKMHFRNLMGYADVEAKKPISEDNVSWIASMTKSFAGASIMTLAD